MEDNVNSNEERSVFPACDVLLHQENFTRVPNEIIEYRGISMQAKMVWIELWKYSYGNNGIFPGMNRMATNLECSKPTILKYRRELEEKGLLVVERVGLTKTNRYYLYSPRNNKKQNIDKDKTKDGSLDESPETKSFAVRKQNTFVTNKTEHNNTETLKEKEKWNKRKRKNSWKTPSRGSAASPSNKSKDSITETPEDLQLQDESNHNQQKSTIGIKDKGDWICQNCMHEHHSHIITDKNCQKCGHPLVWVTNEEQYERIKIAAKEVKEGGGDFSKYCAVPSWVSRSGELSASQKILVGTIISKCISIDSEWCTMRNGALAKKMGLRAETISSMLSDLASKGFIKEEYIYTDKDGNRIEYKSWDSEQPLVLNGLHLVERRLSVTKRDEVDSVRESSQKCCGKIIHANQDGNNKNRRNSNNAEWSKSVHKRDSYTCQKCGDNSTTVNAHHIESYDVNEDLRTSIDNGSTLCEKCHRKFHSIYGQGNNTREQFAKFMEDKKEQE